MGEFFCYVVGDGAPQGSMLSFSTFFYCLNWTMYFMENVNIHEILADLDSFYDLLTSKLDRQMIKLAKTITIKLIRGTF